MIKLVWRKFDGKKQPYEDIIPTKLIVENDHDAVEKLLNNLKWKQYAVLSFDEAIRQDVENFKKSAFSFFAQDMKYKQQFEALPSQDPIMKGRRENKGYKLVKDVKEYIKIRGEEKGLPTVNQFDQNFKKLFAQLTNIVFGALEHVSKMEVNGKTYFRDDTIPAIKQFMKDKSSLSAIHYFKTVKGETKIVSDPHYDTGLLTGIITSSVPGLQIFDREKNEYLEIEKIIPENSFVIMVGRKVPLFANCKEEIIKETLHQVVS